MATSGLPATRLKKGDLILLEGQEEEIFKVKNVSTSAPGKHGHAKVRIMYENIFTGSGGEITYSGHKEIEKPIIEKEKAQVLSVTPKIVSNDPKIPVTPAVVQLMNLETFETYDLQVPLEMNEKEMQSGTELEVRVFMSKKWIERIAPTA
jgi:translation initiation factor 5A